ncbi:MAG TPA: protein kinase [Thermoanaerobaculia bacterium]|jgi:serine/threonine-protein kinase|nr:protein kinase [Thermoanaerobaculia bacterium]
MDEPKPPPGSGSGASADRRDLPERIGSYRVLGRLGRGGMGEVFLAWDDRLRRKVAIKRIRGDAETSPALRQRLLREARAAASLSHAAIVHVFDLLTDDEGDCIVMEYVEGRTLGARLSEGPLSLDFAVRLAREIAEGLATAHAAGIVHRDLKADNVIVTPAGHARVLDFGLARRLSGATDEVILTQHGFILGTCHAMSPEQAAGGEADARSDLFSLGILLYHMLTGVSPFLAATPRETLQRVLNYQPPPVAAVRADVPAGLSDLIARLLAKAPEERPQDAETVVRALGTPTLQSVAPAEVSLSELSTGAREANTALALPRPFAAQGSTAGMSVLTRRRGMKTAAVVILALTVLAVLAVLTGRRFLGRTPATASSAASPLRVLVLRPQVNGKDERLQLAASGVLTTCLSTLSSLAGVDAIGQTQLFGKPSTVQEMAQAAAAKEILATTLDAAGTRGKITLLRQTPSGQVLWTETFPAPVEAGDLLQLAREVDKRLLRGYEGRRLRPGTPNLEARTEDYAAFLAVQQRRDAGAVPSQDDLDQLQRVMDKSPGLLGARLLAADNLLLRFQSTKKIAFRERALDLLRGAREMAPDDPRPLFTQFRIELTRDQPEVAAKTLERFESLVPGDPRVFALRSKLAERDRRPDEAIADLKEAVKLSPTWENLKNLAGLEARTGHIEDSRKHVEQILATSPDNVFALDVLAGLELYYGDLPKAEQRYKDLIALTPRPQRAHYTNLGATEILQRHYQEAITAFHKALEIDPDHVDATLNLGEAELALGHTQDAEAHFRKALEEVERNPVQENILTQAQCLAHLGDRRKAVAIILKALELNPDDPNVLLSAAQVFALVGERLMALDNVEKALKKGLLPRYFSLPAFDSLRNDPEFRSLVSKAPGAPR